MSVLLLEAGPDWRPTEAADEVRWMNPGAVISDDRFAELRYPDLVARRTDGPGAGRVLARAGAWAAARRSTGSWRSGPSPRTTTAGSSTAGDGPTCCRATGGSSTTSTIPTIRGTATTGRCPSSGCRRTRWGAVDAALGRRPPTAPATAGAPTTTRPTGSGVSPYAIELRSGAPRSGSRRTTPTSSRRATGPT